MPNLSHSPVRFVVFGCSHGRHQQMTLPPGDVLVCTGDTVRSSTVREEIDFLQWFESQPHPHRLLVHGNHNWISEKNPILWASLLREYAPKSHYLHDSGVEVAGFRCWGSPYTPSFMSWAHNRDRGPAIRAHWDLIPDDTQVLITHGPALGHLDLIMPEYGEGRDLHQGCGDLRVTIDSRLKQLRLHAYSHLHYEGCSTKVVNGVTYVNAAVVDDAYRVRGQIQVVDLL